MWSFFALIILLYNLLLTLIDFLMPLVTHGFRASLCSFLIHFLTWACLFSVWSMRRRRVPNPKLILLFSVTKVQLISLMSFGKFSSLNFFKLLYTIWELPSSAEVPNRLSKTINWVKWSYIERVILPEI